MFFCSLLDILKIFSSVFCLFFVFFNLLSLSFAIMAIFFSANTFWIINLTISMNSPRYLYTKSTSYMTLIWLIALTFEVVEVMCKEHVMKMETNSNNKSWLNNSKCLNWASLSFCLRHPINKPPCSHTFCRRVSKHINKPWGLRTEAINNTSMTDMGGGGGQTERGREWEGKQRCSFWPAVSNDLVEHFIFFDHCYFSLIFSISKS